MSYLQNKSQILLDGAKLLHGNYLYPAVAHGAYYSCYQLMLHIWIHKMGKTQEELSTACSSSNRGSHEYLINVITLHMKQSSGRTGLQDAREFSSKIGQLKRLRHFADYRDESFDSTNSSKSLLLSDEIIPIIRKY